VAKKSLSDLKALLQAEKADALASNSSSELSAQRTTALNYYNGDMGKDMPTLDGRSSVVSSDVADTIDGLMPSLMEIFAGGDDVVQFEPVGQEDVKAAEQETDYVNYVFQQKNHGFLILHTFIKDALLSKLGVVKVWTEEYDEDEEEEYQDIPDDGFQIILSDPDVELTAHTPKPQPDGSVLHDFEIKKTKKCIEHKVANVPPEEFGFARSARSIRECGYCFHEVAKRESELIEDGFDKAQIKALPSYSAPQNTTEQNARDTVSESADSEGDEGVNDANRLIRITEHYVVMDYEGTGAKLYRVTTGGDLGEVLKRDGKDDIEEMEEPPFAVMTPIIMPHRLIGKSVADLVMDIQRIKTALYRALLDNAYLANNPRTEIARSHAGPNTLDDLLVSKPGGLVRTESPGGLQVLQTPPIGNHVLPLIEYVDATREWRTGVTRQGQGIDANALQNQSATAVNQAFTAAQARMKLIARIFAETGIRDLFHLLHSTIRRHGSQQDIVKLRNEWVPVNPRDWKERKDMTVHVGLGVGTKNEQAQQMMALMGIQEKFVMNGLTQVVNPNNVYNSAKAFTRLIGQKSPDDFFTDPKTVEPPAPKPDPEMMKLQIEGQMKAQEMQTKAALDTQSMQMKAEIEKLQAQADIATQQQKTAADLAIAERKAQLEEKLALLEAELKRREHDQKMALARETHMASLQQAAFNAAAGAETHEQKMEQARTKSDGD
jgi:hypothetical protein